MTDSPTPYRLEVWRQDADADELVEVRTPSQPLNLAAEIATWGRSRGLTVNERVYVWCIRRDNLMVFHCAGEEASEQAHHLIEETDVFAGIFRVPTEKEIEARVHDPRTEHHLEDYRFKLVPAE